ncbi:DUF2807 domain-containing protein [Sphingomonas sp. A2-49]|uniref:head GIN domain-containing protein n=1 Tax=Sphingomonas sp. A2-49 TaxID=1391375 RepID=UPI0021CE893F|nr:head GIN domain-containing protein [Sphingomonas sp. A2-49]MCU6455201.1 DUF2807 domain-containing protein [Sphingomonas sp. A2-49]
MKPVALVLLPLVAAAALASAATAGERDRGPGLPGQRQGNALVYAVRGFDAVSLGGSARMIVRAGPQFAVSAEGPAEAFANFRVVQEGRTLKVGQRYEGRRWIPADAKLIVRVTLPALAAASVGGSGSIDIDRAGGERFAGSVGGSGDLRIARLDVRAADLSIGGSGGIAATGRVGALDAKVGGSGSIDAAGLRADRASVAIGGSGSVRAAVAGPADVSVAGSGNVDLGPQARCRVSKAGSGRVRCGG